MVLAHQHLNQLPTDLRSGMLANARTRICFQLDHDDATVIAKSASQLKPYDFENLARYHIYARLVADGSVTPWCSAVTLPLPTQTMDAQRIIRQSRDRYGRDAAEIETALGGLLAGQTVSRRLSLDGIDQIGAIKVGRS